MFNIPTEALTFLGSSLIGSGITLSIGETVGGNTIVSSLACNSTVAVATLAGMRSASQQMYVNYVSGSGSVTLLIRGVVQ